MIDRCNLTVLLEPGRRTWPTFLAAHGVEIVASLPCYGPENVDAQRGQGVFEKSIAALRALNALGYGAAGIGAPARPRLQSGRRASCRRRRHSSRPTTARELADAVRRRRSTACCTITNMPINRFADQLARARASAQRYMALLVNHFNPATVAGLMCRTLVSVGWDGRLYDCDFNQMLELPLGARRARTIWDVDDLDGARRRARSRPARTASAARPARARAAAARCA